MIKPGQDNPHVSAFWDLLATYTDLAGIQAPKNDGISFAASLRGKKQKVHKYLYWSFTRMEESRLYGWENGKVFGRILARKRILLWHFMI